MGITASVMCNCYREGKTTPCPLPDEFVADPNGMPSLAWASEPDEETASEAYAELREWLESCCAHTNMNYVSDFIASWKGYQAFSDALETLGELRYPFLFHQLPDGDNGITTADIAARMLEELAEFETSQSALRFAVLVDSERQNVISHGSQVLKGALTIDHQTGLDIGFDEHGFFVRDRWEMNRLLFHAMRVGQRLLNPEHGQVEYVDLDTGRKLETNTPFGKSIIGADGLPRMVFEKFHVELRASAENRFAYIVQPLRRVLQASVETGNPVRWA